MIDSQWLYLVVDNDTLKDQFMTHLSISFRKVQEKITIRFNWGVTDNLIIFIISDG